MPCCDEMSILDRWIMKIVTNGLAPAERDVIIQNMQIDCVTA